MLGTGKDHTARMHMDVWTGELWIDGDETIYSPTAVRSWLVMDGVLVSQLDLLVAS